MERKEVGKQNFKISNYEKMKNNMAGVFLQYNQEEMIQKFSLEHNENDIYIYFLERKYSISRCTGEVFWSEDDFQTKEKADYNEVMTIYDVLCNSKKNCHPANEWINIKSLSTVLGGSLKRDNDFFHNVGEYFDGKVKELSYACKALHGKKLEKGDLAYEIKMFPFLSIVLRFWESDEDFPAVMQILTDKNILDYMHYETLMFAMTHILERIKNEIEIFEVQEAIKESSFGEFGCLNLRHLKYYPEVRKICEENTCRNYGVSWACPPAIGTIEQCRERIEKYKKMILFSKKYTLEDSFDLEGMLDGMQDFKRRADMLRQKLPASFGDYLLLSNEGCGRCSKCTYPNEPCRFPDLLTHSLEGYGFMVQELAQEAGIHYNGGKNTVTYFGAIIFHAG